MSDEAPATPPRTMPGRFGGTLTVGGRQGGRTPNIIREGLRKNLLKTARRMEQRVRDIAELIEQRRARYAKALEGKDDPQLAADYGERALADLERLFNAEKTLAEFLAKYGIGTIIAEVDKDGNDVERFLLERHAARLKALSEHSGRN